MNFVYIHGYWNVPLPNVKGTEISSFENDGGDNSANIAICRLRQRILQQHYFSSLVMICAEQICDL